MLTTNYFAKNKRNVIEAYRDTDTTNVDKISSIFSNFEFYVLNTNDQVVTKPQLEVLIVSLGGKKVQNYMKSTTHVVADRTNTFQVQAIIDKYDLNIIRPSWVQ